MKIKEVFVVSKNDKSPVNGEGKIFDRGKVFFSKNEAEKVIKKDSSVSITEGFQIFGQSPLEKALLHEEYNLAKNAVTFYYKSDKDGAKEDLAQYEILVTNILNLKVGDMAYIGVFEDGTFAGKIKYVDLIKCTITLENAIKLNSLSCGYCADSLAKDEIVLNISFVFEVDTTAIHNVDTSILNNIFLRGSNYREDRRKALAEYLNIEESKISCKGYNEAIKGGTAPDLVEVFKFTAGGKDYIVLGPVQSEKERMIENLNHNCMIPQFGDLDNQNSDKMKAFIELDWNTESKQGDYFIYEYPHVGDIDPNLDKWICTDDMQYVKKVSNSNFIVIETTEFPDGNKFSITVMFISIEDYEIGSEDFFSYYISGYGYKSLEDVISKYKDYAYQILAELISETDSFNEGERLKECSSRKEAQEFLKEYMKNN